MKRLDSGFRRDDKKTQFQTFYDFIILVLHMKFKKIYTGFLFLLLIPLLAFQGCSSWQSEKEKLKEEITDVNTENDRLKKDLNALRTENSNMHVRLAQLNLQISSLQIEIQNLQKDIDSFKAQVKGMNKKNKKS